MPSYNAPVNVAISVADPLGANIFYTIAVAPTVPPDPTTASTPYTSPILVEESSNIKALGTYAGYAQSAIASIQISIGFNMFLGYSPLTTLTDAQVIAMSNAPLTNTQATSDCFGTYQIGASWTAADYLYFWWPETYSDPRASDGFYNPAGGAFGAIAMAGAAQGYTSTGATGYGYLPLTVNGVLGRLYRSFYQIGGGGAMTVIVR